MKRKMGRKKRKNKRRDRKNQRMSNNMRKKRRKGMPVLPSCQWNTPFKQVLLSLGVHLKGEPQLVRECTRECSMTALLLLLNPHTW